MLDPRDKLELKKALATMEYYAETLSGGELVIFYRSLREKTLYVERKINEERGQTNKVLRIQTVGAKIAQV